MTLSQRLITAKRALFDKAYAFLNDRQREAVFTAHGPLLVLAGAGSGKTTVLVQRIAYLVRYGDAYFTENTPESMLYEPYIQKLEAIAAADSPQPELLDSALATFAADPVRPYQILAITFTNKAASEIKERLERTLGEQALDVWAGTFHSVCAKLLRMYIDRLGFDRSFTIYDTDDQKRLMTAILKEFEVSDKTFPPKTVLNEISRAKEKLLLPDDYEATISTHDLRRRTILRLYKEYEKRKRTANALDFDDLILLTVKLFEEDEELLAKYRDKFRYILVDEYQDTNKAQFKLTKLLCSAENNIMVVGDDDQSIYKFRGATIDNILNFDQIFPNTKIIKLEQNYRSTGVIVSAANGVIAHNRTRKGKTLWTGNTDGEKITVRECFNQTGEAQYIVNRIAELVAAGKYSFSDFAVLYRMNAQSNSLESMFAKSGIPYRIIGGLRFYERKEIKDVIAYLCVLANPGDHLRLKRIINVPKRGIGDATVNELEQIALAENKNMLEVALHAASYPSLGRASSKLTQFAEMMFELRTGIHTLPIGVFVEKVLEKTGYLAALAELDQAEAKDRTANVKELVSNAVSYANNTPDATLEAFLEEVALVADIDNYDSSAPATVMMTVHSAKGLEFPVVFLTGMEEGVFPGSQTIGSSDEEMEEERRLAYVAITRAKKELYILHCQSRMVFGRTEYHPVSRFVEEIPEEFCKYEGSGADYTYGSDEYAAARKRSYSFEDDSDGVQSGSRGQVSGAANAGKTGVKRPTYGGAFAYVKAHEEAERRAKAAQNTTHFSVGERVSHPVFGSGTVLGVKPLSGDVLYEVAFDTAGTKKVMGNFAKMTRA